MQPRYPVRQQNPIWNMPRRTNTYNQFRPNFRQAQAPQMNRGGGGFLSRLLGRTQQIPTRNPFQFGAGLQQTATQGGIFNPESITRFLGQTQQVLRTGQQIAGMYQQYGPLVRNLPALWKMYKGMNSNNSEETRENHEVIAEDEKSDSKPIHDRAKEKQIKSKDNMLDEEEDESLDEKPKKTKNKRNNELRTKDSVPKLYI